MRVVINFRVGRRDEATMRLIVDNRNDNVIEVRKLDKAGDVSWRELPLQPPHSGLSINAVLKQALLAACNEPIEAGPFAPKCTRGAMGGLPVMIIDLGKLGDWDVNNV